MGRRSGGGGGGLRSSGGGSWLPWSKSRSFSSLAAKKPTKKDPPKPAPALLQPLYRANLQQGLFVCRCGNAVGHRVADAVLGPRVVGHEVAVADLDPSARSTTINAASCAAQMNAFQECPYANGSDLSKCQFYMDMLCECRRSSTTGLIA